LKEIDATVDSLTIETNSICPRCRTKSVASDRFIKCSNSSCAVTYKNKSNSLRVDLIAVENRK